MKKLRWIEVGTGLAPFCRCSTCLWQLSQPDLASYTALFTGGRCEDCGTGIDFSIKADKHGEEPLQLLGLQRKIGKFRGYMDRAWIGQVTDPADFEELERKWYAATT